MSDLPIGYLLIGITLGWTIPLIFWDKISGWIDRWLDYDDSTHEREKDMPHD